MAIRSKWGVPYGKRKQDDPETFIMTGVFDFPAGGATLSMENPTGDQGSGSAYHSWQSLFVDNSLNPVPVTIVFVGTLFMIKIPKFSQGFVPVACPESQFSFRMTSANTDAVRVCYALWSTDIGPSIWSVA